MTGPLPAKPSSVPEFARRFERDAQRRDRTLRPSASGVVATLLDSEIRKPIADEIAQKADVMLIGYAYRVRFSGARSDGSMVVDLTPRLPHLTPPPICFSRMVRRFGRDAKRL
jgi:hypothetical protein